MVVMWYKDSLLSATNQQFSFEAILFDDGNILMQYGPGDPSQGSSSTIGVQNAAHTLFSEYFCSGLGGVEEMDTKVQQETTDFSSLKLPNPVPGNFAILFYPAPLEDDSERVALGGYEYITSDDPGGPSYHMVDIHQTGNNTGLSGDDSATGAFNLGFLFPFFSSNYNQFFVSTNGIITFGSGNTAYLNQCLPAGNVAQAMIAVLWDDLYVAQQEVVQEEAAKEDYYAEYGKKKAHDRHILGLDCFITTAAGEVNGLFPALFAACAAAGFFFRKRMTK